MNLPEALTWFFSGMTVGFMLVTVYTARQGRR